MLVTPENSLVERRRHPRLPRHDRLFIQFGGTPAAVGPPGATRFCEAVDTSPCGLRLCLRLAEALPRYSPLELWVSVSGAEGKYYLCGRVAWCVWRPGRETHELGVDLHAGPSSDQRAWARLFVG